MEIKKEEILELKIETDRLRESIIELERVREKEIEIKNKEIQAIRATYVTQLTPLNTALAATEAELKTKLLELKGK